MVAALLIDDGCRERLLEAGFEEPFQVGQSVLPSSHLGRTSAFNAEGREIRHTDQPKETVYHPVEWTHEQWNGRDTITVTEVIERSYERYPRSIVMPPSVELEIRQGPGGGLYVCGPVRVKGRDDELIVHDVNLLLEIDGHCELLAPNLVAPLVGNLKRLNWSVLPRGNYPWAQLRPHVLPAIERLSDAAKPVIEHRLETVSQYPHDFVAVGHAGFSGYVIFGFPTLGIYVLECTHEGNATYVFGQDWQQLSQLSKAEILDGNLHLHRLIHARNWKLRLREIMREHGY